MSALILMGTVVVRSNLKEVFRIVGAEDMDEEVGTDRDSSKGLKLQSSTCYPHGRSGNRSVATFGSKSQAEAYRAHVFASVGLSFRWKHADSQQQGMVKARMCAARETDLLTNLKECFGDKSATKAYTQVMCWSSLRMRR